MDYQITYTLKEEDLKESKFVPCYKNLDALNNDLNILKLDLKLNALIKDEDCMSDLITDVQMKVKKYIFLLEDLAKHYIYDSIKSDGEVCFYGWSYSQEPTYDKQAIINLITENLCIQKFIVPTPDYYEEADKFNEKQDEIESILDYQEIVLEMIYADFKKKYYTFSDEYKEQLNKQGL